MSSFLILDVSSNFIEGIGNFINKLASHSWCPPALIKEPSIGILVVVLRYYRQMSTYKLSSFLKLPSAVWLNDTMNKDINTELFRFSCVSRLVMMVWAVITKYFIRLSVKYSRNSCRIGLKFHNVFEFPPQDPWNETYEGSKTQIFLNCSIKAKDGINILLLISLCNIK